MRVLLRAMNHPERAFPSVLIAGTNGKGSTAATLASILRASGLKTGLYTSPHLVRINERIRINGEEISDDDFARLHGEVDRDRGDAGRAGRAAVASQLFRDDDGDCVCTLCAGAGRHGGARGRAWAGGWMRPTWSSRWSA